MYIYTLNIFKYLASNPVRKSFDFTISVNSSCKIVNSVWSWTSFAAYLWVTWPIQNIHSWVTFAACFGTLSRCTVKHCLISFQFWLNSSVHFIIHPATFFSNPTINKHWQFRWYHTSCHSGTNLAVFCGLQALWYCWVGHCIPYFCECTRLLIWPPQRRFCYLFDGFILALQPPSNAEMAVILKELRGCFC